MDAFLQTFVEALHRLPYSLDYALVGAIAFSETAFLVGLIIPGEVSMVIAGILAGRGAFSLPVLVVVATIGAILGDLLGWFIGRRWGYGLLQRWRFTRRLFGRRMERASLFFDRHGGKAIMFGRFVGGVRTLIPVSAGIARMAFGRFLPWDVAASLFWATASLSLGYFFGPYIISAIENATIFVSAGVLAFVAVWVFLHLKRRRTRSATRAPGAGLGPQLRRERR